MQNSTLNPPAARRYMGVQDAAIYAGVSTTTVRRWIARKELQAFRPAGLGKVLVDVRAIDALIRAGARGAITRGAHLVGRSTTAATLGETEGA